MNFLFIFTVVGISLFVLGAIFVFIYQRRFKLWKLLSYKLMMILVPEEASIETNQEPKKLTELISGFVQFLTQLSNFKNPIVLEMATPINSEEIIFYVAAPRRQLEAIEKAISSFYPTAQIEPVNDYTIFYFKGQSLGARLKANEHFALPFRTYEQFEHDPLNSITNALSHLAKINEGAALQLVISPASSGYKKNIETLIKRLKEGKSFKDALKELKLINFGPFKESLISKEKEKEKEKEKQNQPKAIEEEVIKLLNEKLSQPLFQVNLRLMTCGETKERAKEILFQLINALKQLEAPNCNSFKVKETKNRWELRSLAYDFIFRQFRPQEALILNASEIASIYHLPHSRLETPKIKWLKARSAPASVNLPSQGVILGKNVFRGEEKVVRILDNDRRRHIYLVGQTGTGKTTLMKNMLAQDIKANKGICFIDPHGDAAEECLGFIPPERFQDVIYFNPGDIQRAIGLNMLECDPHYPFQKTFVVNELLEIMDKLYDLKLTGGPIFEQYMRNALTLLLDDSIEIHTLNDVPRVLINPDFRHQLLERTPNPMIKEFWVKEAEKAGGDLSLANVAPYINSKLNPFLTNDLVRPIVSQEHSSINFRQIMNEGKILIVNLSKGLLGDINSYLMGMLIVGKLTMAAFSRVDQAEEARRDFYLYIDEFQNITTNTVSTILSEARKYRLNLIVANQFMAQLKEEIQKAIFGNIGTLISFRVGVNDAEILANQFAPVFNKYDLINLDNFNAYIKLLINNQTTRAFNIIIDKPLPSDFKTMAKIKELSSLKYGRPIEEVEAETRKRYE